MKTILLSSSILFCSSMFAQDPTVEWIRTYNGPAETFDEANVVAWDPLTGNVVVAGRGWDTEGEVNVFVVEYNSAGDLEWDYVWSGPFGKEDTPYDIAIGAAGEVYVCGQSKTGDGYWDSDMFVFALDTDGNPLWDDTYGLEGAYLDIAYELRLGWDGKIYVCGNDDQGGTNNLYSGGIVNRYTTDGDIDWTIHFSPATVYPYTDSFHGMDLDINQNVVVCGSTYILNTGYDMAAVSYNQDGDQNWINTNPGALNDVAESYMDVVCDINGNTFVLGYNATGEWEIVKYDDEGLYQWEYILDMYFDYETCIDQMITDGAGNLYVAVSADGDIQLIKLLPNGDEGFVTTWAGPSGYADDVFELTTDFQGNLYIAGRAGFANSYYDMLMLKFDTSGNLVWDVNYEGPAANNDEAKGLVVSPDGSVIYLVGYVRGVTPNADLTVVKYAQTVDIPEHTTTQLVTYPNPAMDQLKVMNCKTGTLLHIYNSTGAEVWRGFLDGEKMIDVSALAVGVYSISGENCFSRFVVER